jgi:hypothetical protein
LADGLDDSPEGFGLPMDETARSLGLGGMGSRHSPFQRAILRCARYAVVRHAGPDALCVRRRLSVVPRRLVARLPPSLQDRHARWETEQQQADDLAGSRRRACALALDLAGVEEDAAAVERRLLRWGVHPSLSAEAAAWSEERCRQAALLAAAGAAGQLAGPAQP